MRSRKAAITSPVCSSLSIDHEASCSGERISTSWMPPAVAWVNTGPRLVDHEGLVPLEGRVEVGDDPDQPAPAGPVGLEGGRGAPPRCPGRTGTGGWCPLGRRCCGARRRRGARPARVLTTTQRPDRGSRRSWFICVSPSRPGRPWPSSLSCPVDVVPC